MSWILRGKRMFCRGLVVLGLVLGFALGVGCSSGSGGAGGADVGLGVEDVGEVGADVGEGGLRVAPGFLRLEVGESQSVVVEFRGEDGGWEVLDSVQFLVENPALVEGHGLTLRGRARGRTGVEVIAGGRRARIEVEVVEAGPYRVAITPSEVLLGSTGSVVLSAVVETRNGVAVPHIPVVWRTNDPGVAVVTAQAGKVTANSVGVTTVEAAVTGQFAGIVGSAVVRVEAIGSLVISPASGEFRVGDEVDLGVEAFSASGELLRVNLMPRWTVSVGEIAEVRGQKLVFKKPGRFNLVAEMGGKYVTEAFMVERTFRALTCLHYRCFARADDGLWYAWGNTGQFQLGQGYDGFVVGQFSYVPGPLAEQPGFVRIYNGRSTNCGLTEENEAYCWGDNRFGQAGIGVMGDPVAVATAVAGDLRFQVIRSGGNASCGLTLEGALYCWGRMPPSVWQFSHVGVQELVLAPRLMAEGPFVDIQMNVSHLCAQTPAGDWECMGGGIKGTGVNHNTDHLVAVDTVEKLTHLTINQNTSCALDAEGKVWCWGMTQNQFLGIPEIPGPYHLPVLSPVRTEWDDSFEALYDGGWMFRCGVNAEREIWCWGRNDSCALGQKLEDLAVSSTPVRVEVPAEVSDSWEVLSLGDRFGCVLTAGGEIWCWGAALSDEQNRQPCSPEFVRVMSF